MKRTIAVITTLITIGLTVPALAQETQKDHQPAAMATQKGMNMNATMMAMAKTRKKMRMAVKPGEQKKAMRKNMAMMEKCSRIMDMMGDGSGMTGMMSGRKMSMNDRMAMMNRKMDMMMKMMARGGGMIGGMGMMSAGMNARMTTMEKKMAMMEEMMKSMMAQQKMMMAR